jgi:TonB family protein
MKRFLVGIALVSVGLVDLLPKDERPAAKPAGHPIIADGAALVSRWTPPIYPAEALKGKIGGRVVTRVVVDEAGNVIAARVLDAADPKLGDAALTAVKTWKFIPAIENSKPVQICMDVPFDFDATKGPKSWKAGASIPQNLLPQPAPRTAATAKNAPPAGYPEALTERRLTGEVAFACVVQPDGHARDLQILAANHSDFVLPALSALEHWEFSPATQGDLTVAAELRGMVTFDPLGSSRSEVLRANAITAPDGSAPAQPPLPDITVDAIWPYDELIKGESGDAVVEFTVQPRGRVTDVKVKEASNPKFGKALLAAMEQWSFTPAMAEGKTVAVTLLKRVEFKPVLSAEKASADEPLARLVRLEQAGEIRGGAGLDEKLTPLYRVAPGYPGRLFGSERVNGQAVIEFVVDRDGRARMPRIVSASQEEFGWAAATAVAQWIFKAPSRGGKPTEVRVQIPFNFVPPEV